jgi:hypothetical protein
MAGKCTAVITLFILISITALFLVVCTRHEPVFINASRYSLANKDTDSIEFTILEDNREGVHLYRVWLFIVPDGEALGCQYEGETRTYRHPLAAEILRTTRVLPIRLEAIKTIHIQRDKK